MLHLAIDGAGDIPAEWQTAYGVHVASKLSGTFASAEAASREMAGEIQVIPFDSACGSAGMGFMCKEAGDLNRAGASLDKILERLDFIRQRIQIVLTLNTLEYARMSGRVKALQAALASLLNVKPVVVLRQGVLELADRIRTRQKALDFVVKRIHDVVGSKPVNIAVVNAEDPGTGELLLSKVRNAFNYRELIATDLSISVAANLGPGTVGIVAYALE